MTSRPVIGVTMSFASDPGQRPREYLNAAYTDAVLAAGGLPQPLPVPEKFDPELADELLARLDGLLFTGGPDLDPRHYGQTRHPQTEVMDARRDGFELELFKRAEKRGVPILAVCLGCQIANVARGGCLIQHLEDTPRPTPIRHRTEDGSDAFHPVQIEPRSRLSQIVGRSQMEVNSRHHQALDASQFGGGLRPVAFAPDGTVEAAEDAGANFLLAVQWHPEDLTDRPEHLALFRALVQEATQKRR